MSKQMWVAGVDSSTHSRRCVVVDEGTGRIISSAATPHGETCTMR